MVTWSHEEWDSLQFKVILLIPVEWEKGIQSRENDLNNDTVAEKYNVSDSGW